VTSATIDGGSVNVGSAAYDAFRVIGAIIHSEYQDIDG
jgi:hypothetical protein